MFVAAFYPLLAKCLHIAKFLKMIGPCAPPAPQDDLFGWAHSGGGWPDIELWIVDSDGDVWAPAGGRLSRPVNEMCVAHHKVSAICKECLAYQSFPIRLTLLCCDPKWDPRVDITLSRYGVQREMWSKTQYLR